MGWRKKAEHHTPPQQKQKENGTPIFTTKCEPTEKKNKKKCSVRCGSSTTHQSLSWDRPIRRVDSSGEFTSGESTHTVSMKRSALHGSTLCSTRSLRNITCIIDAQVSRNQTNHMHTKQGKRGVGRGKDSGSLFYHHLTRAKPQPHAKTSTRYKAHEKIITLAQRSCALHRCVRAGCARVSASAPTLPGTSWCATWPLAGGKSGIKKKRGALKYETQPLDKLYSSQKYEHTRTSNTHLGYVFDSPGFSLVSPPRVFLYWRGPQAHASKLRKCYVFLPIKKAALTHFCGETRTVRLFRAFVRQDLDCGLSETTRT